MKKQQLLRVHHSILCHLAVLFVLVSGCANEDNDDVANGVTNSTDMTDDGTAADSIDTVDGTDATELTVDCSAAVPAALRECVTARSLVTAQCYTDSNAACANDNASMADVMNTLEKSVRDVCKDDDYPNRTVDALAARVAQSCISESDSLAWRAFGGPQGAAWAIADDEAKACLAATHNAGTELLGQQLDAIIACATDLQCDPSTVSDARETQESDATTAILAACPALGNLIAVSPEVYAQRVAHQADCIAAAGLADTSNVSLRCGPSYAQFEVKRGEWVQVVVDGVEFGTQCGDGTDYAFWVNFAPEGEPLDRVLVGLQGGGVCIFEDDCLGKPDGLFNALDDLPFSAGILSDDSDTSGYANWTRVYLPYCTQDVFAGGGTVEDLGSISVPRFGSVNLRAAVRMVRDVLWKAIDAEPGPGFRPDNLVAMLGGWSAGGYGTIYNYHWMLDDLQWPRTIAFPDAGLALDNGELLGVAGLGLVKIPAWGTRPHLPPYCFQGECAVGPILYNAISPRLKQVPEQQMMILTNPLDDVQMNDAYFNNNRPFWINTMRKAYCETRELPGINYYFTSISDESVHVISLRDDLWLESVDGETMKDWLWGAYTSPDTVVSRVEEADFVTAIPGVNPYPCDVAP